MIGASVLLANLCMLPCAVGDGEDVLGAAVLRAQKNAERRLEQKSSSWPAHPTFDDPWIFTSEHYVVRQVRAYWFGRVAAESLEQMWPFFVEELGPPRPGTPRFLVEIYPTIPDYNVVGERIQDSDTAYHSSYYGGFYSNELLGSPVVTYDPKHEETLLRQLTHAAAHQYLDAAAPGRADLPLWLQEGMAGYLEKFWDQAYGAHGLEVFGALLGRGLAPSLAQMMDRSAAQWNYSLVNQAALFVHFLLNVCPDTCDLRNDDGQLLDAPFRDYWSLLRRGDPAFEEHPVHHLLEFERARLDTEFRAWVQS